MSQINIEFFEAYKSLEKICNEMYGQNNSVTLYISEMESTSQYDSNRIMGWDADLKKLKRVRHIRNGMAHEGSLNEEACTEDDIFFIKSFYDRILKIEDPLAQKRKLKVNNKVVNISPKNNQNREPVIYNRAEQPKEYIIRKKDYEKPNGSPIKTFLLIMLVIALIIGFIVLGLDLYK